MPRSDRLRPSHEVIVDDRTYTLAINGNAWATFEEVMPGGSFYDSLYKLLDAFRRVHKSDTVDMSTLSEDEKRRVFGERVFAVLREIPMGQFRALVYSTLSDHHPELDLKQVGRLLTIGTMWEFMIALAGGQASDAPTADEVTAAGISTKEDPRSEEDPTILDQGPVLVELPGS